MSRVCNATKLQELDEQMCINIDRVRAECDELSRVLLPFQQVQADAMGNMCRQSIGELKEVTTQLPTAKLDATLDVMQHCVQHLNCITDALVTLHKQVLQTTRFAASVVNDTHCGMLPYLTKEEIACINEMNATIPRASTKGCP